MSSLTEEEKAKRVVSLANIHLAVIDSRLRNAMGEFRLHSFLVDACLIYLQTGNFPPIDKQATFAKTYVRADLDALHNFYEIAPLWAKLQLDPLITEWRIRMYGDPDAEVDTRHNKFSAEVYPACVYDELIPVDISIDTSTA